MSDFEVHPIGTSTEIKFSRELIREIEKITYQYGDGIVPKSVFDVYLKLKHHHDIKIESENL